MVNERAPASDQELAVASPLVTPDEYLALLSLPDEEGAPAPSPAAESLEGLRALSYDMRSPVSSILALGEQLLSQDTSNSQAVQRIMRHAEQLMAMMEGFVAHSQARSAHLAKAERLIDDLIEDAIDQAQELARQRSIHLDVVGSEHFLFVNVSSRLVVRALLNVLLNAIEYSEPGSVVHLQCRQGGSADRPMAEVTVCNAVAAGLGDSAAEEPVLPPGFGQGLDFVRAVMGRHQGQLLTGIREAGQACLTLSLPCVVEQYGVDAEPGSS